jgi:APA family basic amino acid/polyamine antiporter
LEPNQARWNLDVSRPDEKPADRMRDPPSGRPPAAPAGDGPQSAPAGDGPQSGLKRELGVFDAMMMGLGSIVGTGVFVSIGLAAEVAGNGVLVAIALASLVAICNGLSSAQLAARHPISGGTYEYGYRWLSPYLGFTAGWMFLCAKSASAATAALGFAGYLLHAARSDATWLQVPVAIGCLLVLTVLVLTGIRQSSRVNAVIVSISLSALGFFIFVGVPTAVSEIRQSTANWIDPQSLSGAGLLQATALMFVAYTGYGRIATLGEEVKDPARTIPRAVMVTLCVSMVVYLGVAFVGLGTIGAEAYGQATRRQVAPLEVIASRFAIPGAGYVLAVGAVTAMLGVLLNLLLGLSRVLLAMGRRGDMPRAVAQIRPSSGVPWVATLVVSVIVGGLVLLGDIRLTWSFSAFTVLVYYALTNLCVLRLEPSQRLFPVWPAYCGLAACAFLAFWVDWWIWLAGLGLIVLGLAWRWLVGQISGRMPGTEVRDRRRSDLKDRDA